jgi:hypothetical protein
LLSARAAIIPVVAAFGLHVAVWDAGFEPETFINRGRIDP